MRFASDNVVRFEKFMAFVMEFTKRDVSRFPYSEYDIPQRSFKMGMF